MVLVDQNFMKILSGNRIIMCGNQDSKNNVSYSTLKTSCSNAHRNCSSASCIKDYVKNAHADGLYKFCGKGMDIMITPHGWASWAKGLEYYHGGEYYCVAYCTP